MRKTKNADTSVVVMHKGVASTEPYRCRLGDHQMMVFYPHKPVRLTRQQFEALRSGPMLSFFAVIDESVEPVEIVELQPETA